jgi:hypothetical protein
MDMNLPHRPLSGLIAPIVHNLKERFFVSYEVICPAHWHLLHQWVVYSLQLYIILYIYKYILYYIIVYIIYYSIK